MLFLKCVNFRTVLFSLFYECLVCTNFTMSQSQAAPLNRLGSSRNDMWKRVHSAAELAGKWHSTTNAHLGQWQLGQGNGLTPFVHHGSTDTYISASGRFPRLRPFQVLGAGPRGLSGGAWTPQALQSRDEARLQAVKKQLAEISAAGVVLPDDEAEPVPGTVSGLPMQGIGVVDNTLIEREKTPGESMADGVVLAHFKSATADLSVAVSQQPQRQEVVAKAVEMLLKSGFSGAFAAAGLSELNTLKVLTSMVTGTPSAALVALREIVQVQILLQAQGLTYQRRQQVDNAVKSGLSTLISPVAPQQAQSAVREGAAEALGDDYAAGVDLPVRPAPDPPVAPAQELPDPPNLPVPLVAPPAVPDVPAAAIGENLSRDIALYWNKLSGTQFYKHSLTAADSPGSFEVADPSPLARLTYLDQLLSANRSLPTKSAVRGGPRKATRIPQSFFELRSIYEGLSSPVEDGSDDAPLVEPAARASEPAPVVTPETLSGEPSASAARTPASTERSGMSEEELDGYIELLNNYLRLTYDEEVEQDFYDEYLEEGGHDLYIDAESSGTPESRFDQAQAYYNLITRDIPLAVGTLPPPEAYKLGMVVGEYSTAGPARKLGLEDDDVTGAPEGDVPV